MKDSLDQLPLGFAASPPRAAHPPYAAFRDALAARLHRAAATAAADGPIMVAPLDTPLGPMLAGALPDAVCLLEFGDVGERLERQLALIRRRFGREPAAGESALIGRLREELAAYFAGRLREFGVPLRTGGTEFEERVWRELRRIPYGETRSYEALALTLHAPGAQRAVGRANGANPVAVVIPCHRVVNKSGRLGGYGGGLWRKQELLRLERAAGPVGRR
jgi:AraC family transcriptional regulator of adaptative response/methylated-DNA-[protein]-cysteine methyltransferase